jgi:hypothetical protein
MLLPGTPIGALRIGEDLLQQRDLQIRQHHQFPLPDKTASATFNSPKQQLLQPFGIDTYSDKNWMIFKKELACGINHQETIGQFGSSSSASSSSSSSSSWLAQTLVASAGKPQGLAVLLLVFLVL